MTHTHFQLSPATLAALVSHFGSFFPGPDDPEPSGPSAPVVRRALERFGPQPEPWRWAALNPQPLPPRSAFAVVLARTLTEQVETLQTVAQALPAESGESIQAHLGTLISRFVDDCGNGVIVVHLPKGGPWPPGDDEPKPIGPEELVMLGAQLTLRAQPHPALEAAGETLMALGLERLSALG